MDCRRTRDLMSDYLEQYLSDRDAGLIEEHLAGCPDCRTELAELADTLEVVHKIPRQEPVIDLWEEFAPQFAELCSEMNPGPAGRVRLYFSDIISSVREGWSIFVTTVMYNFGENINY